MNNYHQDMGIEGSVNGRSVTEALKDMAALHAAAVEAAREAKRERTWLPALCVRQLELVVTGDEELRAVLALDKGKNHQATKRRLSIPWRGVEHLHDLLEHWRCTRVHGGGVCQSGILRLTRLPGSYWRLPPVKKPQ
ncbi:hypothetical protein CYMTET_51561 [Cymbomonas tetramitiformis]|uniref:Uncharacterized protein n=1 Tax=Cymbomonas tetramitiformis TaxID=36881 RepID=A0AAE0BL10_9CHLO|nr:hypothetical protein CYMTET_51561 [Cymbomonas tetramitiformis]